MNIGNMRELAYQKYQVSFKRQLNWLLKRSLDIFFCILILPFALLLTAIVSLLIILETPGAPIYIQERVGKCGKTFRIFKFRTMRMGDADETEKNFMRSYIQGNLRMFELTGGKARYKPNNTERITRVGRLLRKTSLDELPQIINILLGDMSLVGPRPNVPWEVACYKDKHFQRLEALPGITGLAQVHGRSELTFEEIVKYDVDYIEHQSVLLDIKILWSTVLCVLTRKGAS
jgi:lipopolysaccharide/colanic/teichoic acid biosynthesis glycosyltransferase